MKVENLSRGQVLSNTIWKFLESAGVHILQLIVTIILARLLSPDDYGLMAIVLVVITFLGLFVNSGISSYLVYMKDIKKQDFLTALLFNVLLSVALVFFLFLFSDSIANYYNSPILSSLIRAMAIILPFNAISSVYNAYAMKMSLFKTLFLRNIIALPISAIIALSLAFTGWGVWALVLYQISYRLLLSIIIVATIKIKIDGEWRLNGQVVAPMLRYGGFTFLSSFVAFISDSISDLLIGKKISTEQLGYYNRGFTFPNVFMSVINTVLAEALFPAFASYNSNIEELKDKSRKTLRLLYYATFPLLFGLLACAEPLVISLLSEKWAQAIPVIQLYCLFFCAIPFLQTMSQVYLAAGHVKLRSLGEVVKMISTVILLFCFIDYGILAVVFARILVNVILVVYSMIVNRVTMKYCFSEFFKDITPPLLLSLLMLVAIYPISYLPTNYFVIIIMQFVFGTSIYYLVGKRLKVKEIEEMTSIFVSKFQKRH